MSCSGWKGSLAVFCAAVAVYFHESYGWVLLLVGAIAYDVAHTELLPLALGTAGLLAGGEVKYPSAFRHTHLQRV